MKVFIEKPSEFYQEVKKLIDIHYHSAEHPTPPFAKVYPITYHLYLQIAALGLNKNIEIKQGAKTP